jgi:alanyl-tRNA synthetase
VLGEHVTQKGSLVAPDRLRFDISHPKAMTREEIAAVEAAVNEQIRRNSAAVTHLMDPEEAMRTGALALFGEKYGDEVRVLSMGEADGTAYSTELCGGTHVKRTGDIGLFKITGEGAVASGVRRIEALTGAAAFDYLDEGMSVALELSAAVKSTLPEAAERIQSLIAENRDKEREIADLRRRLATGDGGGAAAEIKEVGGVKFTPRLLDGMPAKDLKNLADELKKQIGSGIVALVSVADGKASLVVGVTDDLTGRFDAVELVRAGSVELGGKGGGGRPDMAQAGGKDVDKLDEALEVAKQFAASRT